MPVSKHRRKNVNRTKSFASFKEGRSNKVVIEEMLTKYPEKLREWLLHLAATKHVDITEQLEIVDFFEERKKERKKLLRNYQSAITK
jgi:hypothetical protein